MSYRAFWQQVLALALPVAFQSALVSALAMADVLMVGHLGSQAVAAVGLAVMSLLAPIEGVYHSLFFGLVNACGIMIGQRLGRGQFDEAQWLANLADEPETLSVPA